MTTTDKSFSYSFASSKTPAEVFDLLLDVDQWWSGVYGETINGASKQVNDQFTFTAGGGAHYSKQKLIELERNKKIVWLVTDSKLNFLKNTGEWTNTKLCFDISPEGNTTKLTFTHQGLVPAIECYNGCSAGWTKYLENLQNKLR